MPIRGELSAPRIRRTLDRRIHLARKAQRKCRRGARILPRHRRYPGLRRGWIHFRFEQHEGCHSYDRLYAVWWRNVSPFRFSFCEEPKAYNLHRSNRRAECSAYGMLRAFDGRTSESVGYRTGGLLQATTYVSGRKLRNLFAPLLPAWTKCRVL